MWGKITLAVFEVNKEAGGHDASMLGDAVEEEGIDDVTAEELAGGGAAHEGGGVESVRRSQAGDPSGASTVLVRPCHGCSKLDGSQLPTEGSVRIQRKGNRSSWIGKRNHVLFFLSLLP